MMEQKSDAPGPGEKGAGAWLVQRVTAVALIPLSLWLTASLMALAGGDANAIYQWLDSPWSMASMLVLLIVLFVHLALGLQVVLEDYVQDEAMKSRLLILLRVLCLAFALVGIAATLIVGSASLA